MALKVYVKKGNLNYKERKLISEIQESISKKFTEEQLKDFVPANDIDGLHRLHREYCGEDVDFTETKDDNSASTKDVDKKYVIEDVDYEENSGGEFIDPMNREEPIVREYVMEDRNAVKKEGPERTNFAEPVSFTEEFELPDSEHTVTGTEHEDTSKDKNKGNNQGQNQGQQQKHYTPEHQSSGGSKTDKKRQLRFAKYIVEAVCMLLEKGFVWYANKDINDSKLAEYELSGEVELDVLISLESGQQATIKQFFQMQCASAEELSKISKEEKEDFSEVLAEYLQEKNIKATSGQELMLIGGKILGEKVISLIGLKSQTNSLLAQLKAMKSGYQEEGDYIPQERPQPQQQTTNETNVQSNYEQPVTMEVMADTSEEDDEKYLLESEATKE